MVSVDMNGLDKRSVGMHFVQLTSTILRGSPVWKNDKVVHHPELLLAKISEYSRNIHASTECLGIWQTSMIIR